MRRKRRESWPPDCSPLLFYTQLHGSVCAAGGNNDPQGAKQASLRASNEASVGLWLPGLTCSPLNIFFFTFPSVFLVWFRFSLIQNQTSFCHRKQRKGITRNESQKSQIRSFVEGQSGSQRFFICRSHHMLLVAGGPKSQCSVAVNVQLMRVFKWRMSENETYKWKALVHLTAACGV